jgi:hypothetical protein
MVEEPEDRLGMTEEQWETFKRVTRGYGDQDDSGIDRSLIRRNLRLSPSERLDRLQSAHDFFVAADNAKHSR